MIEPTDEMLHAWQDAFNEAAAEAVKPGAPPTQTGDIARAGLAAVLAIIERDYGFATARASKWRCSTTERCLREDGHDGRHAFAGQQPS